MITYSVLIQGKFGKSYLKIQKVKKYLNLCIFSSQEHYVEFSRTGKIIKGRQNVILYKHWVSH